MNLEQLVETPLAAAVGWTILHSMWEGAAIAAILGLVLWLVRAPQARYVASMIALFALLVSCGITLSVLLPDDATGLVTPSPQTPFASNALGGNGGTSSWITDLSGVVPWLAPLWVVGATLFFLWSGAGWLRLARLRRRGVCEAPIAWTAELARLRKRAQVSRPVRLLESALIEVPVVLGHLRPLILMPVGLFAQFPAQQIEAILLHELAHIRRNDYLANILQRFGEGLLFYHPAAWWISRVIRAEREYCCDDYVVAQCGSAHEYAAALAALEQTRWPGHEPALAATGGILLKRIRRILRPNEPASAWTPLLGSLAVALIAAASMAAWQAPPPPNSIAAAEQQRRATETPYDRWLNEDVFYLISEAERAAFERLGSDPERIQFIEQFWLRRDPTPGTANNELKEEHYKRISRANERFGSPGRAGWQTDRGRMWIAYGPPDEMEQHATGGPRTTLPYDTWRYRLIEGLGNNLQFFFVDRNRSGEYQLAPTDGR